jgi:hypothetical protein
MYFISPDDRPAVTQFLSQLDTGDSDNPTMFQVPVFGPEDPGYIRTAPDPRVSAEVAEIIDLLHTNPWDSEHAPSEHDIIPDDLPEPGDRCKTCGKAITWIGPSTVYDWEHVEDEAVQPGTALERFDTAMNAYLAAIAEVQVAAAALPQLDEDTPPCCDNASLSMVTIGLSESNTIKWEDTTDEAESDEVTGSWEVNDSGWDGISTGDEAFVQCSRCGATFSPPEEFERTG